MVLALVGESEMLLRYLVGGHCTSVAEHRVVEYYRYTLHARSSWAADVELHADGRVKIIAFLFLSLVIIARITSHSQPFQDAGFGFEAIVCLQKDCTALSEAIVKAVGKLIGSL
jgi:hypothetical protein